MAEKLENENTHFINPVSSTFKEHSSISDEQSTSQIKQSTSIQSESIANELSATGQVTLQGDKISFLSNDFMDKLRVGSSSSNSPSRSAHSAPSKKSISDIPDINPDLLLTLEKECISLAKSVDSVLAELTTQLNKISAISVGNTQACSERVNDLSERVDVAVHTMYSLLAQCEELNETVKPVYHLATKISNLKDVVVTLENHIQ